jgi:hypothetical protein
MLPISSRDPELSTIVSQRIAGLVCELIQLESHEREYVKLLERKGVVEAEIAWLQSVETSL